MLQWCLPGLNVDDAVVVAPAAEGEGEMMATFRSDWESRLEMKGKRDGIAKWYNLESCNELALRQNGYNKNFNRHTHLRRQPTTAKFSLC